MSEFVSLTDDDLTPLAAETFAVLGAQADALNAGQTDAVARDEDGNALHIFTIGRDAGMTVGVHVDLTDPTEPVIVMARRRGHV